MSVCFAALLCCLGLASSTRDGAMTDPEHQQDAASASECWRGRQFQSSVSALTDDVHLYGMVEELQSGAPRPVLLREAIALFQTNYVFRETFIQALRQSEFAAFYWEMPPITAASLDRAFEFVLVSSASLAGVHTADQHSFAKHFLRAPAGASAVVFPNLGGDSVLVAPCPLELAGVCSV